MTRALLFALMCVGCGSSSESGEAREMTESGEARETTEPPAPAVAVLEARAWLDAMPSTPALVVAADHIAVGEGAPLVRLSAGRIGAADIRGGEHGFLVPALVDAVRALPPGPVPLAIDPTTPYGTVTRVVYSAGQAGRGDLAILVRAGETRGALPITLPTLGSGSDAARDALARIEEALAGAIEAGDEQPPAPTEGPEASAEASTSPLALTLTWNDEGVIVSTSLGRLQPGCAGPASDRVVAIARTPSGLDLPALAACLSRLHLEHPDVRDVMVSADSDIAFGEVAALIAASRGTAASPLFPRVALSAGVR